MDIVKTNPSNVIRLVLDPLGFSFKLCRLKQATCQYSMFMIQCLKRVGLARVAMRSIELFTCVTEQEFKQG